MFDFLNIVFNPVEYWLRSYQLNQGLDNSQLPEVVKQKIKAENLNLFSASGQSRANEIIQEYEQGKKGQVSKPLPIAVITLIVVIVIANIIKTKK